MSDEYYHIPVEPQYREQIRKLQNSDPAGAEETFNPLISRLIENTAAVKKQADSEGTVSGEGAPTLETAGKPGRHYFDTTNGTEYICKKVNEDGTCVWEEVGSAAIIGDDAPTPETVGKLGQHYLDTEAGKEYVCVAADGEAGVYTWKESGGGSAKDVRYDNEKSGLTASNVQDAIDELAQSGGGSAIGPQIFVTVDAGSHVTCSDGVTELSAVAGADPVIFSLPNYGTWTVTGTLGGLTDTEIVEVDTAKRYNVTLAYFSATLKITTKKGAAVIATNDTKTLTGTAGEDGTLTLKIASPGNWAVRASTEGVDSNRETVEITEEGQEYEVTLSFITVTITADSGSEVTCTNGSTIRSGISIGAMTFYLPNTGVWKITATKDGQTATETLTVGSYTDYFVTLNYYKYVGVKVTISNNDCESAVAYVEDAVGMSTGYDAWKNHNIFKNIRPCVMKDGVVQYYLDPSNFAQKANGGGATTINSESAGDVMIEIPKLGYKMTTDGNTHTIMVTDDPNADGYCYRAHGLDDEGDCDSIYIGAYLATNISSKLYSLSGKPPTARITLTNARTYAQARGTGYQLVSFYPLTLLRCLYLIMYKNRNGQQALGRGYVDDNSAAIATGGTNAKGMCYGETGGKQQMCFLGIEDFWGNLRWWIDGFYCDSKWNVKTAFKDFKDDGSSYPFTKASGLTSNLGGWMGDIQGTNDGGFTLKTSTGSATSHWADYAHLNSGCCFDFGGYWADGDNAGPFRTHVYYAASNSYDTLGARLMYKKKAA